MILACQDIEKSFGGATLIRELCQVTAKQKKLFQ